MSASRLPIFGIVFLAWGCATSPSSSSAFSEGKRDVRIRQLIVESLHFRRPEGRPADPNAWWDEPEYRSDPLPNSKLDCQAAQNAFQNLNLPRLRQCWGSIPSGTQVVYALDRTESVPKLVLKTEPEDRKGQRLGTPACLVELLLEIPVPREIFFQAVGDDSQIACFAAGLRQSSPARIELLLAFPLNPAPKTDEEARGFLLTWVLSPFWDSEQQSILSQVLPESICQKCIEPSRRFWTFKPMPTLWPPGRDGRPASMPSSDGAEVLEVD